jgi:hypothetical protein
VRAGCQSRNENATPCLDSDPCECLVWLCERPWLVDICGVQASDSSLNTHKPHVHTIVSALKLLQGFVLVVLTTKNLLA